MHLISYLKTPIGYVQSDGREYITVEGVGRLKEAFKGRGILSTSLQSRGRNPILNRQFDLQQMTPAKYSRDESGGISVELEAQFKSPCCGIRISTGEGYIISPAFRLDPTEGQNITLMILAPRSSPYNVAVEKSVLAISKDESEVTVTSDGGELRCAGTISDQTKTARIVLNRKPELPVYRAQLDQTLSELKGQGPISAIWRPVARSFEQLVFAYYPWKMGSNGLMPGTVNLDPITNHLGAPEIGDPDEFDDFVIGDGPGVNYTLTLRIDRGLERHDSDETRVTVA
jgi:hypothetical protein